MSACPTPEGRERKGKEKRARRASSTGNASVGSGPQGRGEGGGELGAGSAHGWGVGWSGLRARRVCVFGPCSCVGHREREREGACQSCPG